MKCIHNVSLRMGCGQCMADKHTLNTHSVLQEQPVVGWQCRRYYRDPGDTGWGMWTYCIKEDYDRYKDCTDFQVRELVVKS